MPSIAKYAKVAATGQYAMTSEGRKSRMLARQEKIERDLAEAGKNAPAQVEAEEDNQRQMESDLARWERQKKAEEQKKQREKAKTFSKDLNKGKWKPKTVVSVMDPKKKKKIRKLPIADIQSPDEEDEEQDEEPLPEGFHPLEESIHCINIRQSDEFKAYLHQFCNDFIQMVRQGRGVEEEYRKVVRSMYWTCKAVGNGSLVNEVDPECVARLVKDFNVWHGG